MNPPTTALIIAFPWAQNTSAAPQHSGFLQYEPNMPGKLFAVILIFLLYTYLSKHGRGTEKKNTFSYLQAEMTIPRALQPLWG